MKVKVGKVALSLILLMLSAILLWHSYGLAKDVERDETLLTDPTVIGLLYRDEMWNHVNVMKVQITLFVVTGFTLVVAAITLSVKKLRL